MVRYHNEDEPFYNGKSEISLKGYFEYHQMGHVKYYTGESDSQKGYLRSHKPISFKLKNDVVVYLRPKDADTGKVTWWHLTWSISGSKYFVWTCHNEEASYIYGRTLYELIDTINDWINDGLSEQLAMINPDTIGQLSEDEEY